MKVLAIIPARYASSRFPAKALAMIGDKSMIQRVYEQVQQAEIVDKIIVATDDERIFQHVQDFGGTVEMTSEAHPSGTDRCAEVAQRHPEFDYIINVQGDEPFIQPQQLERAVRPLLDDTNLQISTLAKKINTESTLFNPNVVKVVFGQAAQALYFSRQTIPFLRDVPQAAWLKEQPFYKHIGLYAFQRTSLLALTKLAESRLEKAERLEQLRWLEHDYRIHVAITDLETQGVDTPEDLERVKALHFSDT